MPTQEKKFLLNYTTEIAGEKTVAEITQMLAAHGATAIFTEYGPQTHLVTSISFEMRVDGRLFRFRIPNDWKGVLAVLEEQRKRNRRIEATENQARRVSWRIIKDWIEAQLAFVESRQTKVEQVFLPYAITPDGRTLGEVLLTDPGRLLGNGK